MYISYSSLYTHTCKYTHVLIVYSSIAMVIFQVSPGSGFTGKGNTVTTANRESVVHSSRSSVKIPQLDGPIPEPYDDVLSTPNVSIIAI